MDKSSIRDDTYLANQLIMRLGEYPFATIDYEAVDSHQPHWDGINFATACNYTSVYLNKCNNLIAYNQEGWITSGGRY